MNNIENLIDVDVEDHGSIRIMRPRSDRAEAWINENIGPDNGYQPYYPAIIVEPRYVGAIVGGMVDDGLVVGADDEWIMA